MSESIRPKTLQERLQAEGKKLTWRRVVSPVLFALSLVALGWMIYQLVAGWGYRNARDELASSAQRAASQISTNLRDTRLAVVKATESAQLSEALAKNSARSREIAATGLAAQFDDAVRVVLVPPAVEQMEPEPFPGLGYSPLSLMLTAKESGQAPSPGIASSQDHEPRVNFVAPVLEQVDDASYLRGFLLVTRPLESIDQPLRSLDSDDVYLDLRSPWRSRTDSVINYGGRGFVLDQDLETAKVPGSELEVGYFTPPPVGVLDIPQLAVWGGVLLSLLSIFGALLIRRQPKSEDDWSNAPALVDIEEGKADDQLEEAMGFADQARADAAAARPDEVPASIFRAYDIRGVIDETLTPSIARSIGQSIGSEALDRDQQEIVVGRDGRISSPDMSEALIQGLRTSGINVVDIGAVPTGVLYYATHALETGSGVMVTGSHNPSNYNGFKIMLAGETLAADKITALYERIVNGQLHEGKGGIQEVDIAEEYVEQIASDVQVIEPLKIVVDAGNGIAGELGPLVLEEIGCEVVTLHCEVDGTFPNHHPDPSVPANLEDLIAMVKQTEADLGVAFDGDGDRLGVVTAEGEMIYSDRLMILFARDVLLRNPGANIIFDVKCTGHLASEIVIAGGSPIMWKTGHSLIKAKMKETGAELAGEMSGHFFFKERWYGFDDGIYAAARLLEILAAEPDGPANVLAALPNSVSTPELKVEMGEGEHYAFVDEFKQRAEFPDARVNDIDGIRADFSDGWGLVRCSNTTPCLVMRFDADNEEALERIQEAFRLQLMRVQADLALPF